MYVRSILFPPYVVQRGVASDSWRRFVFFFSLMSCLVEAIIRTRVEFKILRTRLDDSFNYSCVVQRIGSKKETLRHSYPRFEYPVILRASLRLQYTAAHTYMMHEVLEAKERANAST